MTAARLGTLLLAVGLALALSGCAGSDAASAPAQATAPASTSVAEPEGSPTLSAPAGQRIEVTVAGGQVSGDTGRVPVAVGEPVTLVVTSDVADEIHVHGYELTTALEPGTSAELPFDATVPGVFEVELHEAGTVLLTVQVG
jgi:hypothetical protein